MGNQKIAELLHQYFELGVAEGREGRNHDTEAGDAQRVLSEIEAEIAALAPQNLVGRLGRRIHNQRVRLRYWEELFNEHVHAHLHALHPRHLMKAIELGNKNFRLRQLLSEADKRERETLTQLSELAELEAGDLVKKWNSDLGATVETKAAGAASHIVNDFRGHIEAALIQLERRAALERSEGSPVHKPAVDSGESGDE